jgi:hypothetical protein
MELPGLMSTRAVFCAKFLRGHVWLAMIKSTRASTPYEQNNAHFAALLSHSYGASGTSNDQGQGSRTSFLSLRKTGKRHHAIYKPGLRPRQV